MRPKYYTFFIVTFILLLKITPSFAMADTTYVFTYDASGNRVERVINLTKSAAVNSDFKEQAEAVEADFINRKIIIYPNPTKGALKIEIPDAGELQFRVIVYDLQGKQIVNKIISGSSGTVNISSQPPGMYIMKINHKQESKTWKIIKD